MASGAFPLFIINMAYHLSKIIDLLLEQETDGRREIPQNSLSGL